MKLLFQILLLFIIFSLNLGCKSLNEEPENVKKSEGYKEFFYKNYLNRRNEYPLDIINSSNDIIRIHYEQRFGPSFTFSIEKIIVNNPVGRVLFKMYSKESDYKKFKAFGEILDSPDENDQIRKTWQELVNHLSSSEFKKLSDDRNEDWFGGQSYYVLEAQINDEQIDLYSQPDIDTDTLLNIILNKIKGVTPAIQ